MPRKLEGTKSFPENCFRENQKTEKRLQIILKPHLLFGVAVILVFAFSRFRKEGFCVFLTSWFWLGKGRRSLQEGILVNKEIALVLKNIALF